MSFISWIVGMVFNSLLMKTKYYERLSNLNFIESKVMNNLIGIKYFKWIVINTFFKFFNQSIKLPTKGTDLNKIRHEMTLAEISHLIGFLFVVIISLSKEGRQFFINCLGSSRRLNDMREVFEMLLCYRNPM